MYGCVPPLSRMDAAESANFSRNLPRVLPMIMSKNCCTFTYDSCDFRVSLFVFVALHAVVAASMFCV